MEFGKYTKTIYHDQSRITEVEVVTSKISLKGFATTIKFLDPSSQTRAFDVNSVKDDVNESIPDATITPAPSTSKLTSVIP